MFCLPRQDVVEKHLNLFLLLAQLSGPLGDQVLQVLGVFLQHLDHIVDHVDVPTKRHRKP